MTRIRTGRTRPLSPVFLALTLIVVLFLFAAPVQASVGDRLGEFKECVEVCKQENCSPGKPQTPIPFLHRLLLWNCPQECDYTCQHIITAQRLASNAPVVQFHGKWPFQRFLGMQEPFSVLCSALNLWAHLNGLSKVRALIPEFYAMRPFYEVLAYVGAASWLASCVFHTRDFAFTEQMDYFAAGANVLYGLYYTAVHHFRLDRKTPRRRSLLRAWTGTCLVLYGCHVLYLKMYRWDYGYNMAANVAVGIMQNLLWSWYSYDKYMRSKRTWAMWPGLTVAWVMMAMSLEMFDFAPLWGAVDAHSLWHLGTIAPTILWYNFLVKESQDDLSGGMDRLKA